MNLLWIGDSWKKINNTTETTIRLITEAAEMGHRSWYASHHSIEVLEGEPNATCFPIIQRIPGKLVIGKPEKSNFGGFQKVFIRTDPPFNEAYRGRLKLLQPYAFKSNTEFINGLDNLLTISSKVACLNFGHTPETIISANRESLSDFCKRKKRIVVKPLYSGASRGVKLIRWTSKADIQRSMKLLSMATARFENPIVLQAFIPQFHNQEIRVWFSRGQQVAVIGKKTSLRNFPFRMEKGGLLVRTNLSTDQQRSLVELKEFLIARNIMFAAVDMIGGMIIDLNIGSPGLIVEAEKVLLTNLARAILGPLLMR